MEIKIENLIQMIKLILKKCDVSEDDANIISDSIVYAHVREKHTHGINRLPIYVRKIQEGLMNARSDYQIVVNHPVVKVLDANHGFGQVAGYKAMLECIEMANKFGVGICGVRNSNNFGTAGYLAELATENNMIGLVFGNSSPAIAPYGGKEALFGTNPLGFGFPVNPGEAPIILDMATTLVARGKIRLAAKNNEKIPFGWALDKDGNPTDDPTSALLGSLLPIGGYKGYGLSMVIDLLAGLLTGSEYGGNVKGLNHPDDFSKYGHFLMAINIKFFMSYKEYLEKIALFIENIKRTGDDVLLPGEKSYKNKLKNNEEVSMKSSQIEDLNQLAKQLSIEFKL